MALLLSISEGRVQLHCSSKHPGRSGKGSPALEKPGPACRHALRRERDRQSPRVAEARASGPTELPRLLNSPFPQRKGRRLLRLPAARVLALGAPQLMCWEAPSVSTLNFVGEASLSALAFDEGC
eukprot:3824607-Amphidinium_carterae.1